MWKPIGGKGDPRFDNVVLCLKCADHWDKYGLLKKHRYVWSAKKWLAAFEEFCQMEPEVVDIEAHNRSVAATDRWAHTMFPEFFDGRKGIR